MSRFTKAEARAIIGADSVCEGEGIDGLGDDAEARTAWQAMLTEIYADYPPPTLVVETE